MSQFANIEQALSAMTNDIEVELINQANDLVMKKANSARKKIDTQVEKYFDYLNALFQPSGIQKQNKSIHKYGARWKPLSDSWLKRKHAKGVPGMSYFEGLTKFKELKPGSKKSSQPLLDFFDDLLTANERSMFLGKTQLFSQHLDAWAPTDARILTWYDERSKKQRSQWYGTNKAGHKTFIKAPSENTLDKITLRIMPKLPLVLDQSGDELEKLLARKIVAYSRQDGYGQRIKIVGRNRHILAPLVRWLYYAKIKQVIKDLNQ